MGASDFSATTARLQVVDFTTPGRFQRHFDSSVGGIYEPFRLLETLPATS